MKILDRYIVSSIIKVGLVGTFAFSLIMGGVELFARIDSIVNGRLAFSSVLFYSLLSIPQYFIMLFSLAFVFSSTYFLSSLNANNERIALLNAGISKYRIFKTIFVLALILTLLVFTLQQTLLNDLETKRIKMSDELFGSTSTADTRNIVLSCDNDYLLYTTRYSEYNQVIYNPVIIKGDSNNFSLRINGERGEYDNNYWTIYNCNIYSIIDGSIISEKKDRIELYDLNLDPVYLKSSNINVETMDFISANNYLNNLKLRDRESWQEKATDYYRSLFKSISILLLLSISASFDYILKKNILLFSIIQSLSIAVVYYVSDMVFSIFAHQGAISPIMCIILPILITIILALIINKLGKQD